MAMNQEEIKRFGDYVARKRKELGLTQNQLAELSGVSNGTIGTIETGKVRAIGAGAKEKIERALNGGRVEKRAPVCEVKKIENVTGRMVPIISQAAAAGVNTRVYPLAEYAEEFGDSRMRFFPSAQPGDFAIEVSGGSMEPYYPDKTLLLVRPNMRIPNGSPVVVVLYTGDVIFKIFFERNNGAEFLLASINKKCGKKFHYTIENAWQVRDIYRVVSSYRDEVAICDALADTENVWND